MLSLKSWLARLAAGYNAYIVHTLTIWQGNAYLMVSVEHDGYNVASVHTKAAWSTRVATRRLPVAVRIGTWGIWDASGQGRRTRDSRSWVQRSNVSECEFGVQSSEVARTYARRTETWFLGNFVYDYATICIIVHSPVVGTDSLYPRDASYP